MQTMVAGAHMLCRVCSVDVITCQHPIRQQRQWADHIQPHDSFHWRAGVDLVNGIVRERSADAMLILFIIISHHVV